MHTYTIQCVLTFNLFNERIYAFLWFWIFCVLIPTTLVDMVSWSLKFFVVGARYRHNWIYDRLVIYEDVRIKTARQKSLLRIFAELYVGTDGVFILRLVEHNSNAAIVSELLREMWNQFLVEQKHWLLWSTHSWIYRCFEDVKGTFESDPKCLSIIPVYFSWKEEVLPWNRCFCPEMSFNLTPSIECVFA